MKNIKFLTVIVLLLLSCSKDESPAPEPPFNFDEKLLLKTWTYDIIRLNGVSYAYDHNPNCHRDYFTLRNNQGQVYQYDQIYFTNTHCTGNSTTLTWKPVGDRIDLYWETTKVDEFKVISLTENNFIYEIDRDIDNDGKKEHLTVTAIPYAIFNSSKMKAKNTPNLKNISTKIAYKNQLYTRIAKSN